LAANLLEWTLTNIAFETAITNHLIDTNAAPFPFIVSGNGYSAFIRSRKLATDEIEAKLTWRLKPLA